MVPSLQITFTPNTVGEESVDYLEVHAIGNVSKTNVKLVGKCKGKKQGISLSDSFGDDYTLQFEAINK